MIEIDGKDFAIYPSSFSIIAPPALRVTERWDPSHLSWGGGGAADILDPWQQSIAGVTQRDKQPSALTFPLWSQQFRVFHEKSHAFLSKCGKEPV